MKDSRLVLELGILKIIKANTAVGDPVMPMWREELAEEIADYVIARYAAE